MPRTNTWETLILNKKALAKVTEKKMSKKNKKRRKNKMVWKLKSVLRMRE